jgi:hypothetical protein
LILYLGTASSLASSSDFSTCATIGRMLESAQPKSACSFMLGYREDS